LHKGEGFIVITGEIGAGKTTLVRSLIEEIDDRAIRPAHVVSTQLDPMQLLREVASQFGIDTEGMDKSEVLGTLRQFGADLTENDQRALLVVDEAQNLGVDAIEEIRMLSNFTVGNQSPIQVFLVGQPELRQTMAAPALNQFRQRTVAAYHLGPLDEADTRAYIEHRLARAGAPDSAAVFDDEAVQRIFEHSGGIPRRINGLCERGLMAAYLDESESVTLDVINEAIAEGGLADEVIAGNGSNGSATAAQTAMATTGLASALQHSGLGALSNGSDADALRDINQRITALEASNVLVVQTLRRLLGEIERFSGKPGSSI
jgi:type II secretory pathway predicted ATPase ExeA